MVKEYIRKFSFRAILTKFVLVKLIFVIFDLVWKQVVYLGGNPKCPKIWPIRGESQSKMFLGGYTLVDPFRLAHIWQLGISIWVTTQPTATAYKARTLFWYSYYCSLSNCHSKLSSQAKDCWGFLVSLQLIFIWYFFNRNVINQSPIGATSSCIITILVHVLVKSNTTVVRVSK